MRLAVNRVMGANSGWTQAGLWSSIWKLLRLRLIIFNSSFRRAKTTRKIGMIVIGLLVLAFLVFVFTMSLLLLLFLRSPQFASAVGDTAGLLEVIPPLITGGSFLGILLTSFGVLLQALYLSGDMDFLLASPVPIRAVFVAKLLQAILPNFGLTCLFALPVLWGLGVGWGFNLLYYPLSLLVLASLALAAAGLSSLLVMAAVRIFPARRLAEVLGFFGAVFSFLCSQTGQIANMENFSPDTAGPAIQSLESLNQSWSPLSWGGMGLMELGRGNWAIALLFLGLTLVGSLGLFGIALATAERLYYSGWASMQGVKRKKKVVHESRPRPGWQHLSQRFAAPFERLIRGIPLQVRAIIHKDFLVLRRDLKNMSQLVTPLIFGIVYAVMLLRNGGEVPAGRGEAPPIFYEFMRNIMVYGNVGISLFVGWLLLARLASMGFSHEGKSYWLLKSAPVSSAQLLMSKFLVAFLPVLALGWLFLAGISLLQPGGFETLPFTMPVVALAIFGNTGVNLSFGVVGANMQWEDPRQMQRTGVGCLGTVTTMLYLPFSLLLFFGPPLVLSLLEIATPFGNLIGLALGGAFCLLCGLLPLWFVSKKVDRLGE